MEQKMTGGFVSADGHVVEPADLWTTRIDKRFRDRAPRVESRPDNDYYVVGGLPDFPVGLEGVMTEEKIKGKIEKMLGHRHADARRGAWDPQARLVDQDLDNLQAEVIYPGLVGLQCCAIPDPEFERECVRVYNDWLAEFCAVAPNRLLGAAILPIRGPIEWTIAEAERTAKKGLRTVLLPTEPERPYYAQRDLYDPLWTALQDLGLPVSLHVGTGKPLMDETFMQLGPIAAIVDKKIMMGQRALISLICAGVPQKYPKLRFVLAESGIGWIASILRFMDHWWTDHRHWIEPRLEEAPSTYFKRQFWATFEDDRAGILTRELIGVDRLMWGADYPHTEGTFPHSREQVANDFTGIPEGEVYQMVAGNAAALYRV